MKVGIVGASGYSGEEMINLLFRHPKLEIGFIASRRHADLPLTSVFPRFSVFPKSDEIRFSKPELESMEDAEIIFLALPHGVSAKFALPFLEKGLKVIDLSADFRLKDARLYKAFYGKDHPHPFLLEESVYGLVEIHREKIRKARLVASPGCYPTSVLLPLIPLLSKGLIEAEGIIANSLSSPSGAGRKLEQPLLFVECNEGIRPYGIPLHRHLPEMEQELSEVAGKPIRIQFSPHLVPIDRGILTTLYMTPSSNLRSESDVKRLNYTISQTYEESYSHETFIHILGNDTFPNTKNVTYTNGIEIAWCIDPRTGRLIVMSAEDNLLKGAGGQAMQCLNLMSGFDETMGLL